MYIGIDVGGTKLEGVLVEKTTSGFNTVIKKRLATERDQGYSHIIQNISKLVTELISSTDKTEVKSIGLGLPGSIDPKTNIMLLGNTHALENKPIIEDLKKSLKLNVPIFCENDANCFAFAETYLGAGLDYSNQTKTPIDKLSSIGIILGTGVGGGIIVEGKILKGRRGAGGEVGHTTLYFGGEDCYCERRGCAEQYLSGPAVERQYQRLLGTALPSSAIFKNTDSVSLKISKEYVVNLGILLGNLSNVIDPDLIVLGGGVSLQPIIYEYIEAEITKNLFVKSNPPKVLKHKISDSSGSLGAALVAWRGLS